MNFLKDVFFPKICLNCGLFGGYLCFNCRKKLKQYQNKKCFVCRKPSLNALTHHYCLKKLPINGLFSIFLYDSFLKKIIKIIKYRLAKDVFSDLLNNSYPFLIKNFSFYKALFKDGKIQPIPLSKKRLLSRGFNQAIILAEFFKNVFNLPVTDYLERKKETPFLAKIKEKRKRFLAIKGAFKLKNNINNLFGEKIILVDDVLTTGNTVKEAAKILKKIKVEKIYVLTLARSY